MFKKMFAGELGKLGVNLDLLLDKKNLLLFHGLDLVRTNTTLFCLKTTCFLQEKTKPEKAGKTDKKVIYSWNEHLFSFKTNISFI